MLPAPSTMPAKSPATARTGTVISWRSYIHENSRLHPSVRSTAPQLARHLGLTIVGQHINLLGEYDFSDEKLQDMVGIKPPKLADQRETFLGAAKRTELPGRNGLR